MGDNKNKNIENNLDNMDELLNDDILSDGEGVVELSKLRKKKEGISKLNKILIKISVLIFIIFLIVFGTYKFFDITIKKKDKTEFEKLYVNLVSEYIISNIFGQSELNIANKSNTYLYAKSIKNYIDDTSKFYYEKKELVGNIVEEENNYIRRNFNEIKKYQDLLVKYKYLPEEISKILKDIKVMPILLVLNSIKIYITDYIFIKTSDFKSKIFDIVYVRSQLPLKLSSISKEGLYNIIVEDLQYFREEGVSIYLKNIVFNYMNDGNDNFIESYFINKFNSRFNSYLLSKYNYLNRTYGLNISKEDFITYYVRFIGRIYNQTNKLFNSDLKDFLPVDVQLLSYNPADQSMSFNIKLMIEAKKKISLVNVSTNIISLLRASRLIIGSNIKFNTLKTTKFTKRVSGQKLTYNTTDLIFKTYIQDRVNVEVSDVEKR